jgi:hypothetical protein
LGLFSADVFADPVTPGNLVVTVNEFTGGSDAPTYLAEFTTSGTRTQIIANIPMPGGGGPTDDEGRDLVFDGVNSVYLYNGTFTPYLARYDLTSNMWTQQTYAEWSTVNNATFGGLSRLGSFIYATDMSTFNGGEAQGIVRFDTLGGPTIRFAGNIEPLDLNIGPNHIIYALNGAGLPNNTVYKYDALTGASLGTVPIDFDDNRAIGVASDGSIFIATFDGIIRHYSATGSLLNSLDLTFQFTDLNIDPLGRIALGTDNGQVVLTDETLKTFTQFQATDSKLGGTVFVEWVVPEPSSVALFLPSLALVFAIRKRGKS